MRAYRRHLTFVTLFLAAYIGLGCVFRFTRPGGEIFPVSSWTLFQKVPNRVTEYGIEVVALEGRALPAPRAYHEAREIFAGAGDVRADRVVQRMGAALRDGDEARLRELARFFEARWLGAEHAPLRYRLVRRVYSPLERWRSGALLEETPLRDFAFEGPAS